MTLKQTNIKNILYHGTKEFITKAIRPDYRKGGKKDFGEGFYTTDDPEFAKIAACTSQDPNPRYLYEFHLSKDFWEPLDVFTFEGVGINWLMYVAYNRRSWSPDELPEYYKSMEDALDGKDVIIGPTADDRYYTVIKNFINPDMFNRGFGLNLLLEVLERTAPCVQYTLKKGRSNAACSFLPEPVVSEISLEEYKTYFNVSEKRIDDMKNEVASIIQNFPREREGMNFSELKNWINSERLSWADFEAEEKVGRRNDGTTESFGKETFDYYER